MTKCYPIVVEREASGAVSAYVPGLPIYAAADTRSKVEESIRATLAAYLDAHGEPRRKARTSQLNGRLGGRPPKVRRRVC